MMRSALSLVFSLNAPKRTYLHLTAPICTYPRLSAPNRSKGRLEAAGDASKTTSIYFVIAGLGLGL